MTRRGFLALGAGALLSACGRPSGAANKPSAQPNIVVFLADTLRADFLGCYGSSEPASHCIDAFSRGSILFERCYSACCWTKPSIASLITGVLPRVHRAGFSQWDVKHPDQLPVQALRECFTTLAESLSKAGYHTALLLSNPHVKQEWGFARGYDHYRFENGWQRTKQADAAIEWIRREAREPFFLFIHEIDPHSPYLPEPERFRRMYGVTPGQDRRGLRPSDRFILDQMKRIYAGTPDSSPDRIRRAMPRLSPESVAHVKRLYAAEISGVDDEFARIVGCLDETGMSERTAVVFTSDHGESFGERGPFFHGNNLHREEVHVPLIVRLPGPMRRGIRVPWSVSLLDLYPTLATLAGAECPGYVQGRPLLHRDGSVAVRGNGYVFAEVEDDAIAPAEWSASLIIDRWKVLRRRHSKEIAVFDCRNDPDERTDLGRGGHSSSQMVPDLLAMFRRFEQEHLRLGESFGEPEWTVASPEHRDQLDALGYL